MKTGIATGTPLVDGIGWLGAVVACIEDNVLAIGMGADPQDTSAWRVYRRGAIMLSRNLAFVVHTDADRERIVLSWYRRCGRLDQCLCEARDQPRFEAMSRQPHAPAAARRATGTATRRPQLIGARDE